MEFSGSSQHFTCALHLAFGLSASLLGFGFTAAICGGLGFLSAFLAFAAMLLELLLGFFELAGSLFGGADGGSLALSGLAFHLLDPLLLFAFLLALPFAQPLALNVCLLAMPRVDLFFACEVRGSERCGLGTGLCFALIGVGAGAGFLGCAFLRELGFLADLLNDLLLLGGKLLGLFNMLLGLLFDCGCVCLGGGSISFCAGGGLSFCGSELSGAGIRHFAWLIAFRRCREIWCGLSWWRGRDDSVCGFAANAVLDSVAVSELFDERLCLVVVERLGFRHPRSRTKRWASVCGAWCGRVVGGLEVFENLFDVCFVAQFE